jgi:carbamoyl-phosphate synthase large subunit
VSKTVTLLVTSAGRRVELLRCFMDDARALGISLRVLAADLQPELSAACAIADARFAAPRCTSAEYGDFLLELCRREGVDLLVPTIDTELPVIAALRDRLARTGTYAAVSTPQIVALARDKLKTAQVLDAAGIRTPRSWALETARGMNSLPYPLMVKPRDGSSSKGIGIVPDSAALAALPTTGGQMVQELLQGDEYTVNLFFDRDGILKCVVPHKRIETRAGEVSKAETQRLPVLEEMGWKLGECLDGARGVLCFQAFVSRQGVAHLFEINARFGGGYPIAHRAGAPFSRWLLEECAGLAPTAANAWQAGVRMLRFDAAVFA